MSFRAMGVVGLVLLVTLAGCGRKNLPVPPVAEGQPAKPYVIAPDGAGLARAPVITNRTSETSVVPSEVTRNPGAENKPFLLDRLLN
ncbi:hypothetical protein FPY71_17030 [Aureimonas fodinaquatilis]|uniref:Lipoprotein n=1 Tax=Aureimonas fodinaquatilis TaxID=2565783 RepID=A0A5B0DRF5_9HYPH|nr:hypothetical protein [Aureimonas fodinaquatilis]KAA0968585.1 hypothetical protein FPY71_17030 [Aureimonas fodinaquatilis]